MSHDDQTDGKKKIRGSRQHADKENKKSSLMSS